MQSILYILILIIESTFTEHIPTTDHPKLVIQNEIDQSSINSNKSDQENFSNNKNNLSPPCDPYSDHKLKRPTSGKYFRLNGIL